ncbi:cell envelope-related function transcriptional attenuator common domain-containing protein [Sinosporangium album]|uniref:Cell envelope-related function transcriptional attenuator common domain-containing protein n=1 Tax=Sinosporangium album TaxID=504805 RepID=A0A1G7SXZ0_9ACTN|nr:LCP family protein [Sinosporangium album]SDG27732.1 cell envelope-related function transcriptional attenuator common domain-containing protein [Sinosporangium album]
MDDLTMLRDLGRDLEHEPPAGLVRQRARLLDAAGGGTSRRPTWFARLWAWPVAAVIGAAAITAAAMLVPTLLVKGSSQVAAPLGDRPARVTGTLNVLLVGTDSEVGTPRFRTGQARAETIMLVHLPADRGEVTVVNLPRDSMVATPKCASNGGRPLDKINAIYAEGGMTCLRQTVETLTRVRLDHALAVDFSGFKAIVDALDGVRITVPSAIDDAQAKLRLPAGTHMLDGEQALGYARVRYTVGDGSDVSRIKRQQVLVKALVARAKEKLTDPAAFFEFAGKVRKAVTADTEFDAETQADLFSGLAKADVTAVTVPWEPYPGDRTALAWRQPDADRLFARLNGKSTPTVTPPGGDGRAKTASPPPPSPHQAGRQVHPTPTPTVTPPGGDGREKAVKP